MKAPFSKIKKIAITSGDANGIGLEVTAKALSARPVSSLRQGVCFFLFRSSKENRFSKKYLSLIDTKFSRFTFSSLDGALGFLNSLPSVKNVPDNIIIDLALNSSPAEWVVEAAMACDRKSLDSLVTGPLSKSLTAQLGNKPLGHTGIFRLMYPKRALHMAFWGPSFNVLLATDHVPLDQVGDQLKRGSLKTAIHAARDFKRMLRSKKEIGVLGFNPHSGERGLIGKTEQSFSKLFSAKDVVGPLVPDAAFLNQNWDKYCVYVCLYHDQGLIPFKMQHGQDAGVHITMGLPFVRTSVDHGTATDIYKKDVANYASMAEAIEINLQLIGVRHV